MDLAITMINDKELILEFDKKIKNINRAKWLKTMNYYPKTVEHFKLLISIVDRTKIFDKFDIDRIATMDGSKINIIYAILRLMNKVYGGYLDYVVKKIFRDGLKELFGCTNKIIYYDMFMDQLTQDIDYFVCSTIKKQYSVMDKNIIKSDFIQFLSTTFNKRFYNNLIDINNEFYKKNDILFSCLVQQFIKYTNTVLAETYDTMEIFLEQIFSSESSEETINAISTALKKHINLKNLFEESCMEIDIYVEHILDTESNINRKVNQLLNLSPTAIRPKSTLKKPQYIYANDY